MNLDGMTEAEVFCTGAVPKVLTQLTATVISAMESWWPLTKKLMFGQRTTTYLGVKNILSAVWKISKMIYLEAFNSLKHSLLSKKV